MKKKVLVAVIAIIILIGVVIGCVLLFGNDKGPINITPAVNEVSTEAPTPEPIVESMLEQTPEPIVESMPEQTPVPISEDVPEHNWNSELHKTDNPRIAEMVLIFSNNTNSADDMYIIPQFQADTENAMNLNQRIEADILPYMKNQYVSITRKNHYEVFEFGDMVSILVSIPDHNDIWYYYAYTYDFANGKEVTNLELLALRGMTEESFVEAACKMEEEYWEECIEDLAEEYKSKSELKETYAMTTSDLPMYLDTDGNLKVFIPFPSLAGATWYYGLCEF